MKDWQEKRQKSLAELSLAAHIMAYLITIIILIVVANLKEYTFYTSTIILMSTILPAAIFILMDYHYFQRGHKQSVLLCWNITKHTVLFLVITVVLANSQREHLWLFGSIYLLPVALSCITLGKRWGIAFAGASMISLFLLWRGMDFTWNQAAEPFEALLVLGGILFILAWFLSGILEVEKENAGQLRQERDLIARMMDTSPAGIMVLDRCCNIIYVNTRLEQIFDLKGPALQELFNKKITGSEDNVFRSPAEVFWKVLAGGEPVYNNSGTIHHNEEETIYLSISGAPIFDPAGDVEQVVLTVNDITQQKKMNEEILKADKLDSIGLLAGGIAHDFNNFMAVILGNISLVKIRNKDKKISVNLEHMENASLQARELTRKLFVFAKGGAPVKKTVHMQKLLMDTVGFVLSGSMSVHEIQVAEDLYPVEADESQIGQVINNIVINAVQAMPGGGKISLSACNITLEGNEIKNVLPLPPGDYVRISIVDEGVGIPANQLDKIFDPFYSTKLKGSGLGLATSHTIIQNHGGIIQVESQPGLGSNFFVYLPAYAGPYLEPQENKQLYFGEGRILIMDDDELILKTCSEMLKYLGYHVSCAYNGAEAIRLYKEALSEKAESPFIAVILDLTIPGGMGGKEAIKQLRKIDPEVKAIVSSGYSDDPVIANYQYYGFSECVNKPYQIKQISRALAKIIDNKVKV
ncbi:hybrid sensor histidine kinase/response regulator [Candidatus Contubernalis alkaliaceticus]|uniref:hybrid sensor histidine kinase/response regulator n=1 Tax=Candidatus Contubernalis alkaliaceticus TaxID=338645 RepID=UPI001F4BFC45|nr:ATP-binding protein [Candidatus Contubernalis alkalaceticus]UNC92250.1 response regulator [Candidatus Contubernalis alkalaceticus]